MDQTAQGQQTSGLSSRAHWKNTVLAGLANYIDAGSIVAGAAGLTRRRAEHVTSPPLTPTGLRCAHRVNPLGVAPGRVRFSWALAGPGSSRSQRGYQLVVAPDDGCPAGGGAAVNRAADQAAWDSGRVESSCSADIACGGAALTRGQRYRWQVRAWDETDTCSEWSEPAWFETELDPAGGWRASWLGLGRIRENFSPPAGAADPVGEALTPVPYLRRRFRVDRPVVSARLHATAPGLYEARLNGQRVGDAVLAPGWTDYARRIPYQSYDVTGLLQPGENVIGAMIADGWYSGFVGFDAKRAGAHYGTAPEFLAQLVIRLDDGTDQWVVTDAAWQGRFAAIRHADLLMGERHDLALEPAGWDAPGFDTTGFDPAGWRAVRCRERDRRPLVADPGPPVRVTQELAPRSITRDAAGRQVVDFGQNLSGWLRIQAAAPAGTRIRIRHAEVLADDGSLYSDNLRTARQADEFITAGVTATCEPGSRCMASVSQRSPVTPANSALQT